MENDKKIDEALYNEKSLDLLNIKELRDIGRKFGVPSPTTMKKQDLIEYILNIVYGRTSPKRSNYGRPNVRDFNLEHYVSKIKKNSDLTEELLKVKLDDFDYLNVGVQMVASPKDEILGVIENRVYIEENDKCYLRVHGFVESEKDIEIDKKIAEKFNLENFDVVEAVIEERFFKIISINGNKKNLEIDSVLEENGLKDHKKVFMVCTKEEREEKINEIIKSAENHNLKLMIFANKKHTEKCAEFIEYQNSDYSTMYKNFMKFVSLCEKYAFEGENMVIIIDDLTEIEDMCASFETDIADRMMSNIQQKINRFASLRNLFVSFRVETSKAY